MDREEGDILVNIFQKGKRMRVIAELPGVREENIRLDLGKDTLAISANLGNRNYYKSVRLPRLCENIIGRIYNSGILEVTLC